MLDSSWLLLPIGSPWLSDHRKQIDTLSCDLDHEATLASGVGHECCPRTLNTNIDVRAFQMLVARIEIKVDYMIHAIHETRK